MIKRLFLNDRFILGLILINSVVLFLGGYLQHLDKTLKVFITADNAITLLFLIEILIKIKEFGMRGYFKIRWNIFDFILVVLSIPALITYVLNIQILDFSFLLVFRILRVFKTFRFFKFIPNVGQ